MLTHGNMVANILQARAWFKQVEIENTTLRLRAAAVSHLFADGELPAVHLAGRHRPPDRQSP
jgi:hypothetical protein